MILIPVTLLTAAAAFILNTWLGMRIARLRRDLRVSVGDGGHESLLRRMRAQANFIESAPFFLVLLGGLELSSANRAALAIIASVFVLARIAHGYGMDGGPLHRWRAYGIMTSFLMTGALAIWAVVYAARMLSGG